VKRRWRAVFFTTLALVIGAAATMAVIGMPRTLAFGGRLTYVASGAFLAANYLTGDSRLINLDATISRLFWEITGTGWNGPIDWIRRLLVTLAEIALLALTIRATPTNRSGRDDDCAFALWVATAALLSPTAWVHYMVLLLAPFAVLAVAAIRGQASPLAIWLGLASFLLLSFLTPAFDMLLAALPALPAYWLNTNFYALLTLLAYASAWRLTTGPRVCRCA
jgi:hypothetical protein